jgi:hypothetical protein
MDPSQQIGICLGSGRSTYHFQGPHSSNPDLQSSINALDVIKVNTFPPATTGRLSPEEQKLLSHTDSVVVEIVATLDIGPQTSQSNAADDGLVGLTSAMTPSVLMVEATGID